MNAHSKLVREVLVAISDTYERAACVQKINTMAAKAGDRYIASAAPGTADILGAICCVPVAIECKTGKGVQGSAQKLFQTAWTRAGGCYIVGRSAEGVLADIQLEIEKYEWLFNQFRALST
jgi:hypothetical protein